MHKPLFIVKPKGPHHDRWYRLYRLSRYGWYVPTFARYKSHDIAKIKCAEFTALEQSWLYRRTGQFQYNGIETKNIPQVNKFYIFLQLQSLTNVYIETIEPVTAPDGKQYSAFYGFNNMDKQKEIGYYGHGDRDFNLYLGSGSDYVTIPGYMIAIARPLANKPRENDELIFNDEGKAPLKLLTPSKIYFVD